MKDASGHEHVGKGSPQGGQFGKGGGGDGGAAEKAHHGHEPGTENKSKETESEADKGIDKEKPLKPETFEEAKAIHSKMDHQWRLDTTIEEMRAIKSYTGDGHAKINEDLRNGEKIELGSETDYISNALDKAQSKESMITYRGIDSKGIAKLGLRPENAIGTKITDPGFLSMSLFHEIANSFSQSNGAVFEIHVPKGSKAASVGRMTENPEELEIIAQRGSTLRITKVEHREFTMFLGNKVNKTVYHAELEQ